MLLCLITGRWVYAESTVLTVKLATTDWCPYSCPEDNKHQGMAHDYVEHILSQFNIQTEVMSFPWARAIRQVDIGASHGLLTAVHSESPNLLFTQVPMMSYQMCFYGLPSLDWEYVNEASLSKILLAVISQYGYGKPVEHYLADQQNREKVIELSGDAGLQRLVLLVESGRANVFIEDKNVFNWYLKNHQEVKNSKFKQVGCLAETPFYLALSPDLAWAPDVIKRLNKEFAKEKNHKWLADYTQAHYQ